MKKITLLIVLILGGTIFCQAQKDIGTWYIGGQTNLSYSSTDLDGTGNINQFNIGLKGGSFVTEKLMFGFLIEYFSSEGDNMTSAGAFGRYYLDNFFLGMSYKSTKFKGYSSLEYLGFDIGFDIMLNDFVSIEPSIGYDLGMGDISGISTLYAKFGIGFYL